MTPANDHQPRRGLSRVDAAGYIGVGVMLFDELVRDGRMPRPLRINTRILWDRRAVDLAFDDLSVANDDDEFAA